EAEAVGPIEIVREQLGGLRIGPHAEHALEGQLLLAFHPVELGAAVRRIAEVNPAVGPADDVVGAVELLALIVRGDRHDAPVGLRARHLAGGVLAREQAPLAIVGEPVGHVARLAEGGDAVPGRPAAHVVARHVAPEQKLARRMPQRPLGEEEAAAQLLEGPAHFLPGVPATYQSGGVTSLKTTQTASRGSLQTSVIVSVTRRAISSL